MALFGENIQDYNVYEMLGAGGFGKVYRGQVKSTEMPVAIKFIEKAPIEARGILNKVITEARIHQTLKNPNISEMYTAFDDDIFVYFILELGSMDLDKYFKSKGKHLSEPEVAHFISQIVGGLKYLHSKNIIHRDLKLNNILLFDNNVVKICDLGLANDELGSTNPPKTMCGTRGYIAPEVYLGRPQGVEVDIWSLGVILYILLVGEHPSFVYGKHLGNLKIPAKVSQEGRDLIRKMLRHNSRERIKLSDILNHPFFKTIPDSGVSTWAGTTHNSSLINFNSGQRLNSTGSNHYSKEYKSNQKLELLKNNPSKKSTSYNCVPSIRQHLIRSNVNNMSTVILQFNKIISSQMSNSHRIVYEDKPVPPISTSRLEPFCQKVPGYIARLLQSGDFIVEMWYVKKKMERVGAVMKIASDGENIKYYKLHGEVEVNRKLAPCLDGVPNDEYTYQTLPQLYWQMYFHASMFVNIKKSLCVKITYYSNLAKCQFMENKPLPNFKMKFYKGENLIFDGEEKILKIEHPSYGCLEFFIDRLDNSFIIDDWAHEMFTHFVQCYDKCIRTEIFFETLTDTTGSLFPLDIGQPPKTAPSQIMKSSPAVTVNQFTDDYKVSNYSITKPNSHLHQERSTLTKGANSKISSQVSAQGSSFGKLTKFVTKDGIKCFMMKYSDGSSLILNVHNQELWYEDKHKARSKINKSVPPPDIHSKVFEFLNEATPVLKSRCSNN